MHSAPVHIMPLAALAELHHQKPLHMPFHVPKGRKAVAQAKVVVVAPQFHGQLLGLNPFG